MTSPFFPPFCNRLHTFETERSQSMLLPHTFPMSLRLLVDPPPSADTTTQRAEQRWPTRAPAPAPPDEHLVRVLEAVRADLAEVRRREARIARAIETLLRQDAT